MRSAYTLRAGSKGKEGKRLGVEKEGMIEMGSSLTLDWKPAVMPSGLTDALRLEEATSELISHTGPLCSPTQRKAPSLNANVR